MFRKGLQCSTEMWWMRFQVGPKHRRLSLSSAPVVGPSFRETSLTGFGNECLSQDLVAPRIVTDVGRPQMSWSLSRDDRTAPPPLK